MTCKNCNNGVLEPVNVDEPNDEGHFSEEWQCVACNARGYIHGKEEAPSTEWDRFGSAFDGGEL
jgi:hypothetical protein